MNAWGRVAGFTTLILLTTAAGVRAQVQTGSITGIVTDASGGVLPGVTVSLSGKKLIGGVQTEATDTSGTYRFSRLPPGDYHVKFELQGFKMVERPDIRVSASFVATVNARLEVGQLNETITITGESPTVDTRSNVQQAVMNQEILEGVPTGRDPWSLAKIIPGVQISTYDVGGTQSMQASLLSAHGSSTNDVSYNIDGNTVNWPGSGGGATMLYYDQGMFEEVNYQTSAIPAEVMAGGISINMVTKEAGNQWRGNARFSYAKDSFQANNTGDEYLRRFNFTGNPTKRLYDFNMAGGGPLFDTLWVTGTMRRWVVDRLTSAKNPDGSRAIDNNTMTNYYGKVLWQVTKTQKLSISFSRNNKVRGHRRDTPPDFVPDVAALLQRNPANTTQVKYTGIRSKAVFESSVSAMVGETLYNYQPETPEGAIRVVDPVLSTADVAAARREELPNSRIQFDNSLSYGFNRGGEHLVKVGVQFARLYMNDQFWVNGDMYLVYNNRRPTAIQIWNTPTHNVSIEKLFGVFAQDSWTIAHRLTLNLGARFDVNRGIIPEQSSAAGTWVPERTTAESTPIDQKIGVWRTGASYDPTGNGKTAVKASYSRYGLQVGLDRVQNVHPFQFTSATCPWSDSNGDNTMQSNEIGKCSGFPGLSVRYARPDGPKWPYSDEVTVGIEQQVARDIRVGLMYYHRTNKDQIGLRNEAVPWTAYTPVTVNVPSGPTGPGGTATLYNLDPSYLGRQDNVLDNNPYLDTLYRGFELTLNKRFSHRWQMLAGLTVGKNTGGLNTASGTGQATTTDLNDPNNVLYTKGVVGNDSKVAFRLAGSYRAPWDISVSGSLISNGGYPYVSTYSVNRTIYAGLTRSSQTVALTERGAERLPTVTMFDLRLSRPIPMGAGRRIVPQLDIFNIGNASAIVRKNASVGGAYLAPAEIVAPRIIRLGFTIDF